MSDKTKIEWTDATWNPVTGCSRVSAGCAHCYAETVANRFNGTPAYPNGFTVTLRPERLDQPLRWKRPRRIFVNSMSDLFHDDVPFEYIDKVFAVMALSSQHTFQLLTKRPSRMLEYFTASRDEGWSEGRVREAWGRPARFFPSMFKTLPLNNEARMPWPLPNVWLGVSVENQKAADERIPLLLQCPAAVRFLSCEPLLGPVDLTGIGPRGGRKRGAKEYGIPTICCLCSHPLTGGRCECGFYWRSGGLNIDWVIAGGESGPHARPMHPDWARSLREQCAAAGVPFFFKQWGEWRPSGGWIGDVLEHGTHGIFKDGRIATAGAIMGATDAASEMERRKIHAPGDPGTCAIIRRVGKRAAGRLLDGRTWDEFPKV